MVQNCSRQFCPKPGILPLPQILMNLTLTSNNNINTDWLVCCIDLQSENNGTFPVTLHGKPTNSTWFHARQPSANSMS